MEIILLFAFVGIVCAFVGYIAGDLWAARKFHRGMMKAIDEISSINAAEVLKIVQEEFYGR